MNYLYVYKTEPDDTTRKLADGLAEGNEVTEFKLYEDDPDYAKLVDLIFENDKVISWW